MADSNVERAQVYLNAMFGGDPRWVNLKVDGFTGSAVMAGIIRAFQIQNGIPQITGSVGPLTLEKMQDLDVISKMDPDDEPSINVCLIQCALYCKGYNAGGVTGIFYNTGVAAVKEMQADAGIPVTGTIDWKVWSGLLSMNWFKLVSRGDTNIQLIQRQLNSDWSDIVGVGPCDGVVSRHTALSLVGALQAAEGVTTELIKDINSVNFGPQTAEHYPGNLKQGQNSSSYIPFNKLAQYGLYLNGYHPGKFDGQFGFVMQGKVAEFQEFYGLTGIGLVTEGEVDLSTMMSLLTSKGDVTRSSKACDCATVLNRQQALDLKAAGYTHVGRYLTGSVGNDFIPKFITLEEIENIKRAGLKVFPIYQDGGNVLEYFQNETKGTVDGQTALLAAERIGIPENTTIYFAVDFDCYEYQIDELIIPYFRKVNTVFRGEMNSKNYKIGIYAPRYVCTKISSLGLAVTSFVADMSTGFSCNLGFPLPFNWAFDQFEEFKMPSSPRFDLDKDAYSGRDTGVSSFDPVEIKSDEEIENENKQAKINVARNQYIYDVLDPLGYLDKVLEFGISLNKKIVLNTVTTASATSVVTAEFAVTPTNPAETDFNIGIEVDGSGNLTAACENQIFALTSNLDLGEFIKSGDVNKILRGIGESVKVGNMTFSHEIDPLLNSAKLIFEVGSDNIFTEDEDVAAGISVKIEYTITLHDNHKYNDGAFREAGIAIAVLAAIFLIGTAGTGAIPGIIAWFLGGGYVVATW